MEVHRLHNLRPRQVPVSASLLNVDANLQVAKSRSAGILMVREVYARQTRPRDLCWLIILSFLSGMLVLMIAFGLFARGVPANFPIWICGAADCICYDRAVFPTALMPL
jgi:hypothetical protein